MASSSDIEREVESQRASVESTLDALKQKMSVGQLVDEFGGYVGADDAKQAFRNVGRQVRDNPIALGLVGVGLAWLMMGGSKRSDDGYDRDWEDDRHRTPGAGDTAYSTGGAGYAGGAGAGAGYADEGAAGAGLGVGQRFGSAYGTPYGSSFSSDQSGYSGGSDDGGSSEGVLSRAGKAVTGAAHTIGEKLSAVGGSVSGAASGVSGAVSSVSGAVSGVGGKLRGMGGGGGSHGSSGGMSRQGRRVTSSLAETMEHNPLLVGLAALAAGVALGAALPATRAEDRLLGEGRDGLIDEAKHAAMDLQRQAVEAAKAGVRAASDAAQEQGLAPGSDGKTLAEKVETVVRAGVDETRRNLDLDRLGEDATERRQG